MQYRDKIIKGGLPLEKATLFIKENTQRASGNYLYRLKLTSGKYYVGITNRLRERMINHFSGNGSAWTKEYSPIELTHLIKITDDPTITENLATLETIEEFGIDNVRGGKLTRVNLCSKQYCRLLHYRSSRS